LDPADLGGRAVSLLVLGGDAEDDGRPVGGGAIDLGVLQLAAAGGARRLVASVDPDERHRPGTGGPALPHRHVHGILQDPA